MTSHHDKANPPPDVQATLELDGPTPEEQILRLRRELEAERSYRKQIEKDLKKFRRVHWHYKAIDDLYKSLKQEAEDDAQNPFDEHFRRCLYGLQEIAANPDACTCKANGWHGEGHNSQCPIRIAEEACQRADLALENGLKAKSPLCTAKGGEA